MTPTPVGTYGIDPNTGLLTFTDRSGLMLISFSRLSLSTAMVTWARPANRYSTLLAKENYGVYITKTHETYQGGHEYVDVNVFKGSEEMWGFDMLIAYDASAVVVPGRP